MHRLLLFPVRHPQVDLLRHLYPRHLLLPQWLRLHGALLSLHPRVEQQPELQPSPRLWRPSLPPSLA